jgi:hypothetical protein
MLPRLTAVARMDAPSLGIDQTLRSRLDLVDEHRAPHLLDLRSASSMAHQREPGLAATVPGLCHMLTRRLQKRCSTRQRARD